MITRVPMNISAGTRDARELLVSLLVESLVPLNRIVTKLNGSQVNKLCRDATGKKQLLLSHADL